MDKLLQDIVINHIDLAEGAKRILYKKYPKVDIDDIGSAVNYALCLIIENGKFPLDGSNYDNWMKRQICWKAKDILKQDRAILPSITFNNAIYENSIDKNNLEANTDFLDSFIFSIRKLPKFKKKLILAKLLGKALSEVGQMAKIEKQWTRKWWFNNGISLERKIA